MFITVYLVHSIKPECFLYRYVYSIQTGRPRSSSFLSTRQSQLLSLLALLSLHGLRASVHGAWNAHTALPVSVWERPGGMCGTHGEVWVRVAQLFGMSPISNARWRHMHRWRNGSVKWLLISRKYLSWITGIFVMNWKKYL